MQILEDLVLLEAILQEDTMEVEMEVKIHHLQVVVEQI